VPAGAPGTTLYSRIGDLFGWLCTVAAVMLVLRYRRAGRGKRLVMTATSLTP
jgi:apolipoprotein N-acyltransferase